MADGVLLLVDAAEGPLPQTRFVLSKALDLGLPIVVVINKIDRQDARPDDVLSEVFDLFCELGASDAQADFPTLYAIGKHGVASTSLAEPGTSLVPLMRTIMERVRAPKDSIEGPLQMLVYNVEHDDYVGRLAVGRIARGKLSIGDGVSCIGASRSVSQRVSAVYTFEGTKRVKTEFALARRHRRARGLRGRRDRRHHRRRRAPRGAAADPARGADDQGALRRQLLTLRRQGRALGDLASRARSPVPRGAQEPGAARGGRRRAGQLRGLRPRRADAGDPGRDHAPRRLRVRARHARGRGARRERRALGAGRARDHRRPRPVHRRGDAAPRRAARSDDQDARTWASAARASSSGCRHAG